MRKKTFEIIAEGLREAGILLIVFGPIACIYDGHESGRVMHAHVIAFIVIGLSAFGAGVFLEAKRWQGR